MADKTDYEKTAMKGKISVDTHRFFQITEKCSCSQVDRKK